MIRDRPLFTSLNRGFRYGDGVFETIKIYQGKIMLEEYHFDRLFTSLGLLKMMLPDGFARSTLAKKIIELCELNQCLVSARVRMAVYREDGHKAGFVIEANVLDQKVNRLNEEGWRIDVYPHVRKSCDAFSNIKSANYLPYVLADLFARETNYHEAIVLNTENKLCDASKANIFLLLKDEIFTPALHQGCVNGVKRRFIIEELKKRGIAAHQQAVDESLLFEADEVFLTNAINDIRWIGTFRNKTYGNSFVNKFYEDVFSSVYQ